ncbi:MAG: ATPase [Myxococcales bacterium]|nr:ATPase [Myxococcales bacterium]
MEIASIVRSTLPPGLGSPLPEIRPRRMSAVPAYAPGPPSVQKFGRIAASSPAMAEMFSVLRRLARTDVSLTLIGETGTGKDVTAHAVHDASARAAAPFVVFDCGAVPPNLVESELFGHERGAFTGAHAEHEGAFERARGGTLFLDEIGELPLDLQPRLLRALDSHAVRRVGGTRDRRVDVRIIAATNRDLGALVEAKQFRQDLYFRLAAAVVNLPPLRDRLEDLSLLVPQLLVDLGRGQVYVPEAAYEALRGHRWPGNVRELKNVLAYALAFVDAGTLEPGVLRFTPAAGQGSPLERLPLGGQTIATLEHVAIRQTLALTRGNKVQAARLLGIASSTLYEKLKRYGL